MSKEKTPIESKAKEEADRIVDMFDESAYDSVEMYGTDSYKIGLHAAIIYVEGIIKENKSILNLIKTHAISSLRVAHPIEWRLEELQEVLTILKENEQLNK